MMLPRRGHTVRRLAATLCMLSCMLTGTATLPAQTDAVGRLNQYKAVFIYNFVDFVEWPDEERPGPLKIAILGDSPVAEPLREIAEIRRTRGRRLQLDSYKGIEDLRDCHALFIAPEYAPSFEAIRQHLGRQSVLTIGNSAGLATRGAGISFVLIDGRLRFEINRKALTRAGLQASSQLLKLAILVDDSEGS